ncbi:hypothetical protein EPUS_05545 [Endocarpon pusillum Z07020]|uniref:Transmembrane protein n=1 Tax=Endocarpon pusillum (strain Z07020 / HMAS-L-300199) TaxID=1263415 RepID=U1HTD3_ENDPU|nr:uncharacterized protein EPUS_05545 [Endocarpon pusillum Z07020]ERF73840.1 hypothetical protein EPUS_05545 [Endocarpon pusillum Z07020]
MKFIPSPIPIPIPVTMPAPNPPQADPLLSPPNLLSPRDLALPLPLHSALIVMGSIWLALIFVLLAFMVVGPILGACLATRRRRGGWAKSWSSDVGSSEGRGGSVDGSLREGDVWDPGKVTGGWGVWVR